MSLYRTGGFSWTTLVVAIGYPMYFVLRKKIGIDNLGGLWLDMLLMVPVALWFVLAGRMSTWTRNARRCIALVPLMGIISAAAGFSYISGQPVAALQPVWPAQLCRAGVAGGRRPAAG
jgi:chloramphenicol-sensitive protein RarD